MDQFTAVDNGDVQWLIDQKAAGTLPVLANHYGAKLYLDEYAAMVGQLDVLKWVIENREQGTEVIANNHHIFQLAVENGHLEIVKWLVEESNCMIKIAANDNWAVRQAAGSGYLAVAKYLEEAISLIDEIGLKMFREYMRTRQCPTVTRLQKI